MRLLEIPTNQSWNSIFIQICAITEQINIVDLLSIGQIVMISGIQLMRRRHRESRRKRLSSAQIIVRNKSRLKRLQMGGHQGYSPQVTALLHHKALTYGEDWPDFPELYQLTSQHIPELLYMTLDSNLDKNPTAQVHALRSLGQLGAESVIPILTDQFADERSIYLEDVIIQVFALLGSSAIPHLENVFDTYLTDEYPCILAVRCLEQIACTQLETKDMCASVLATQLSQYHDQDDDFNGCVASSMLTLKATGYQYLIEDAFKARALSDLYVSWEDLDRVFNPRTYYRQDGRVALTKSDSQAISMIPSPILKPVVKESLPVEEPTWIPFDLPFREIVSEKDNQVFPADVTWFKKISPAIHKHQYESPLDKLLKLGYLQGEWLSYSDLGIETQHIPELLRMASDKQLGSESGDTLEFWGTAHARRALAQLGAETAIEPFIKLFREWNDDVVWEDLPLVMAAMGSVAIEALESYLAEESAGQEWQGSHACTSLELIARRHPESRDRCVAILTKQLECFAKQDRLSNAFLIHSLIKLKAVEAAPYIEPVLANEYDIDADLTGDWFHVQYQLGLMNAKEADQERENYWRKRNQKKFGWFGRNGEGYTWLDDGHDFTEDGFVDRAYLKTRAARWAYRLSQGWFYGPYAIVSMARTDATRDAQIAGIAIIDEQGNTLLDTLIKPEHSIPAKFAQQHGISDEQVEAAPNFIEVSKQIKAALTDRALITYGSNDSFLLDRICSHHGVPSVNMHGSHGLQNEYAYFWSSLNAEYNACIRQSLVDACIQQVITIEGKQGLLKNCHMMQAVIFKMANWLAENAEPELG